jgi:hypothetical protein
VPAVRGFLFGALEDVALLIASLLAVLGVRS